MYKLANKPELNVKYIPEEFKEKCVEAALDALAFAHDLKLSYEQAQWYVECLSLYDVFLDAESLMELDSLEWGGESPVWGEVSRRESTDAFRASVKANWLSGCRLEFDLVHPCLNSMIHLRPEEAHLDAEVMLAKLAQRL